MPWGRLPGWVRRFEERHPDARWTVTAESARVEAADGAWARCRVPLPPLSDPSLATLLAHLAVPRELGILLVRRGGFAVAQARDDVVVNAKVGRRHVQGRTKAGGWSQQRFARRRDNQARQAFDAATDHGVRVLAPVAGSLALLAVGGDRSAIEHALGDRRLSGLAAVPRIWVPVSADPRRAAVDTALQRARSLEIDIVDPTHPG